ncbi:hypothetical protein TNCV_1074591 [Trichonephila clavipes]|uniref:Uncharacterized protein n=1 Tax=Trichonephila clavipes TaxID=2585209 RepID=A0A8X6VQR0_TRICX|nr:hypothetical protein TNCV_1074591 [Trichonephila clavipes]
MGILKRAYETVLDSKPYKDVNTEKSECVRHVEKIGGIAPPLLFIPDLTSSDLCFFGPLKKHFGGQHSRADGKVQQAVLTWLYNLYTDFYDVGFDSLAHRFNKCLDKYG